MPKILTLGHLISAASGLLICPTVDTIVQLSMAILNTFFCSDSEASIDTSKRTIMIFIYDSHFERSESIAC